MAVHRAGWACLWLLHAFQNTEGQVSICTSGNDEPCFPDAVQVGAGCATAGVEGTCAPNGMGGFVCANAQADTLGDGTGIVAIANGYGIREAAKAHGAKCQPGGVREVIKPKSWVISTTNEEHVGGKFQDACYEPGGCACLNAICIDNTGTGLCALPSVCPDGINICDDPHMKGLRGQKIDWSGIDGAWYNLVKDDDPSLRVNVRLTAPLPEEFPDRQLITGLSVLSEGHSLVIEVKNPYDADTNGCPLGVSPCLANGGLRAVVDGEEEDILRFSRDVDVVDGITVSASNLPAECRQFGGDKIWARMYEEVLQGTRKLAPEETFEDWILRFDDMAAPDWCAQYIEAHDLAVLQSIHAVFKIVTPTVTVRLNVGTNYQDGGDLDWDGRVLPELEFWQMDVGLHGLSLENESLSGILGETARPVLDADGREVMEGYEAFRGTVADYFVNGPLGTNFALLNKRE